MNKMDLRQLGTIMGLPVYIDLASIPEYKGKKDIMSERDRKEFMARAIINRAFDVGAPTDEEVE